MREVVDTTIEKVSVKDTSTIKFYGLLLQSGTKTYITKNHLDGKFMAVCVISLTNGDYYTKGDSLQKLLQVLLKAKSRIFEFDTHNELFKWLAE